jgi:NAD(P) transhydrogenase
VNSRSRLLGHLDAEVGDHLRTMITARLGISVHVNVEPTSIKVENEAAHVTLSDGSEHYSDVVLFSAGRVGNTGDLGLADIGVTCNKRGYIEVAPRRRTSSPPVM